MPRDLAFLCLPNFSMLAFSGAVDVLSAANQVLGREVYRWQILSSGDETQVQSSSGVAVAAEASLNLDLEAEALFICGGNFIQRYVDDSLIDRVAHLARRGLRVGGICTGTYVLARARLLDQERCTIHNDHASSLLEEFPGLVITRAYFELNDHPTSAGGLSPMLMMLAMVAADLGHEVAVEVASAHLHSAAFRHSHARQHAGMARVCTQNRLEYALDLMDANIEEPLSTEELAQMLKVTKRQLQRLFKKYLNDSPMGYYARLRLERARELVLQTNLPIGEIAQKRGFSTPQHFCRIYRQAFGVAPMQDRRKLLAE